MIKKITFLIFLLVFSLGYSQDPTTGPTNPIARNAEDVVSMYNGIATPVAPQYTNQAGVVFDPFGTAAVIVDLALADGNTVKKYTSHNFSGIGGGSYNVSSMTTLHIDVYFENGVGDFRIKLEDQTGGAGATEISVENGPTTGEWKSYDIPLTNFTAPNLASLKWIVPVTTAANTTLYFDNIYFWRPATDPATDATLSDLSVDGATISDFSPNTITYTYEVPTGTTIVPQITSATTTQASANVTSITQASGVPGDATVLVTAQNGTTTKTYTVSIVEVGPATAAPTPPSRDPENVISIYSDAYANVPIDDFDFGLCGGVPNIAVTEVMIAGNSTQQYTGAAGCQGISVETNRLDASTFTNLHVDFYTDDAIIGAVFNLKLVDWNGNTTEATATGLELNFNGGTNPALVAGQWISLDFDLTTFAAPVVIGNLTRSDIAQIHITSNLPSAWYDNLYLYKEVFIPGTCSDGVMNQDETGIDCGGIISGCAPCSGVPTVAAPTPPVRATSDVISIYSDAYTNVPIDNFDFGLCGPNASVIEVMIAGNPTQNYTGAAGCQGISVETNRLDASTFTNLHVDFYTDDAIIGAVFNLKLVDWNGNTTEATATGLELNFNGGTTPALVANQWVSLDFDLTAINAPTVIGNLTRSDIAQIHITSNIPNAWYDNLYLYKGTPLSINEISKNSFRTYPNPTQDNWTIETQNVRMSSITVYDVLGKRVMYIEPKSENAVIDGSSLKSGLYFAKVETAQGVSSVKLVKK